MECNFKIILQRKWNYSKFIPLFSPNRINYHRNKHHAKLKYRNLPKGDFNLSKTGHNQIIPEFSNCSRSTFNFILIFWKQILSYSINIIIQKTNLNICHYWYFLFHICQISHNLQIYLTYFPYIICCTHMCLWVSLCHIIRSTSRKFLA